MVLGDVGWDRKESPKSNLHVCGKDDTKIAIYNPEECAKMWRELRSGRKSYETKSLVCFEDKFDNRVCVKPS